MRRTLANLRATAFTQPTDFQKATGQHSNIDPFAPSATITQDTLQMKRPPPQLFRSDLDRLPFTSWRCRYALDNAACTMLFVLMRQWSLRLRIASFTFAGLAPSFVR